MSDDAKVAATGGAHPEPALKPAGSAGTGASESQVAEVADRVYRLLVAEVRLDHARGGSHPRGA